MMPATATAAASVATAAATASAAASSASWPASEAATLRAIATGVGNGVTIEVGLGLVREIPAAFDGQSWSRCCNSFGNPTFRRRFSAAHLGALLFQDGFPR